MTNRSPLPADALVTSAPELSGISPSRRRWLAAGVAGAAVASGAGLAWWRLTSGAVEAGAEELLWQRTFFTPEGAPLSMAAWRGRPLLVNFWATWCPPCVRELPMLSEFAAREQRVQVLGLAVDQPAAVQKFLQRQALKFPIAMAGGDGSQLARELGNLNGGLPFTVFLGPDGKLQQRKMGELTAEDLLQWVKNVS